MTITQERLKELFDYDPETGLFTRRFYTIRVQPGSVAGYVSKRGPVVIRIGEKLHYAHRLAWLYMYGYLPEECIDHINRDPTDNRLENLREVSHQCNTRNQGNSCRNTSGVRGVHWEKGLQKWKASLGLSNKNIALGRFDDFSDAVCARLMGEQCYKWSGCDSSSPAFQYVKKYINPNAK